MRYSLRAQGSRSLTLLKHGRRSKGYDPRYASFLRITMVGLTAEDVLRIHPKIRWAGLTSDKGELIFARMRPGIESFTPEEDDRYLLQFGALIMNGVTQHSGPWLGKCEYVAIAYEKTTQLIVNLKEKYLALTVEKSVPWDEILEIVKSVQALRV